MSTNIAAERGRALQTLYNDNPALSSCFIGGTPGVGIVAVNRCPAAEEGGEPEYAIWPQCVSVALVMTIIGLFRPTWDNASADRIGAHPYTRSASREASNGIRAAEVKLATAHSNTAWRRWRSRRAVSAFVCQMGARISSKSALVTSDTGIFPMRVKAYRSKVKIHSRPCARLRQPACFCSTTRAVASAKLGSPCARRFSVLLPPSWVH